MAHFSKIENNKVVQVLVVDNTQEHRGQEFLANDLGLGGRWVQTSYNTRRNTHRLNGVPFRKNYGAIGYTYDEQRDAFLEPKPAQYPSWVLNENGGFWEPPVPRPTTPPEAGKKYVWDEATVSWIQVPR